MARHMAEQLKSVQGTWSLKTDAQHNERRDRVDQMHNQSPSASKWHAPSKEPKTPMLVFLGAIWSASLPGMTSAFHNLAFQFETHAAWQWARNTTDENARLPVRWCHGQCDAAA